MELLIKCLQQKILPENESDARILQKKAKCFEFYDGTLYKKLYTHSFMKCVTLEEGNYILREIHEGGCGIQRGVRTVINKFLRSGYYWPSLGGDVEILILRCSKFQFFPKVAKSPTSYLTTIQSMLPFDKWGMDHLGLFPPAKGQRKIVIVAIDYFSKYVEVEPLSRITDIPRVIITNN